MSRTKKTLSGLLILVLIFFILLVIFAVYSVKSLESGALSLSQKSGEGSIGVIEIKGPIMGSKQTIDLLLKAQKDKSLKALIIRVNSPGGAVGPSQEIYQEIRRIDELYDSSEGKEGLPVYSSFGTVAASGGYYVGAAARKIYSNPGTVTGSIGVIMQFMNLSELYKWAKVDQKNIKAGRYKDIGQPNRSMTEEEEALLDSMIGGVHQQFIQDIVQRREKRIKGNIQEIAQGQIYSGEQAHKLGLVDEMGGLYYAGRDIHKSLGLEGEFGFKFIEAEKKSNFWQIVKSLDSIASVLSQIKTQHEGPVLLFK